jgi:hypothetical protein
MSRVQQLEQQIQELSKEELQELRAWFAELDAISWDQQLEADAHNGKLARLAETSLNDHAAGRSADL